MIKKYVWLLDVIMRNQPVSFKTISEMWRRTSFYDGKPLYERKFHKWLNGIDNVFGFRIVNNRCGDYGYYIENDDKLGRSEMMKWLLETTAVSNLITSNTMLHDRILVEHMPSSRDHLGTIIDAMRDNHCLEVTYQSFWSEEEATFPVEPYCVKAFKQRWYMLAHSIWDDRMRVYALDRINALRRLDDEFTLPKGFSAEEYFADSYGVQCDEECNVETVRLRVSNDQAHYLRSLKLHPSQKEVECGKEVSIFELRLRPTFDFMQEILLHTPDVEVLAPQWLRDEVAARIETMNSIYQATPRVNFTDITQ